MSEYTSNRQRQLKIGISSYTENNLVLDVIGNTNITGVTTLASAGGITTTGGDLYVKNNLYISGILSATSISLKLENLTDVDITPTNKKDQYVLMYNATTNKYKLVNPDDVLSASSTTELTQPGLPGDFLNQLDTDLDNKIDVDGGTFG